MHIITKDLFLFNLLRLLDTDDFLAWGSEFCSNKCSNRCAVAAVQDRCLKYCGICCEECKCVPSGTYGNKHECPCYRDKKNKKGKPKCP